MKKNIFIGTVLYLCVFMASAALARAKKLDDGIIELRSGLSAAIKESSIKEIAVLNFTDLDGTPCSLGRYISERMISELAAYSGVAVVERDKLSTVLQELSFQQSGAVSEEKAQKLGSILGVGALLLGSITDMGRTVEVNARLVGTADGRVLLSAMTRITKNDDVTAIINRPAPSAPVVTAGANSAVQAGGVTAASGASSIAQAGTAIGSGAAASSSAGSSSASATTSVSAAPGSVSVNSSSLSATSASASTAAISVAAPEVSAVQKTPDNNTGTSSVNSNAAHDTAKTFASVNISGLVAWYQFSGNLADSSNNHRDIDGSLSTFSTDRFGRRNSAATIADDPLETPALNKKNLTISLWVSTSEKMSMGVLSGGNKYQMHIISPNGWPITEAPYNDSHCIAFLLCGDPAWQVVVVPYNNITDGRWHHVVLAWNGASKAVVYVDGEPASGYLCTWSAFSAERTSPFILDHPGCSTSTSSLVFGRAPDKLYSEQGTASFSGALDDIRLYNRILNRDEIGMLFHENGW